MPQWTSYKPEAESRPSSSTAHNGSSERNFEGPSAYLLGRHCHLPQRAEIEPTWTLRSHESLEQMEDQTLDDDGCQTPMLQIRDSLQQQLDDNHECQR